MKGTDNTETILKDLRNYNPKFDEGFSSRVMDTIEKLENDQKESSEYTFLLKWISLSGIAAVILLLITIYFTEGSLHTDAIFGLLDYSPDEPLFASLNY